MNLSRRHVLLGAAATALPVPKLPFGATASNIGSPAVFLPQTNFSCDPLRIVPDIHFLASDFVSSFGTNEPIIWAENISRDGLYYGARNRVYLCILFEHLERSPNREEIYRNCLTERTPFASLENMGNALNRLSDRSLRQKEMKWLESQWPEMQRMFFNAPPKNEPNEKFLFSLSLNWPVLRSDFSAINCETFGDFVESVAFEHIGTSCGFYPVSRAFAHLAHTPSFEYLCYFKETFSEFCIFSSLNPNKKSIYEAMDEYLSPEKSIAPKDDFSIGLTVENVLKNPELEDLLAFVRDKRQEHIERKQKLNLALEPHDLITGIANAEKVAQVLKVLEIVPSPAPVSQPANTAPSLSRIGCEQPQNALPYYPNGNVFNGVADPYNNKEGEKVLVEAAISPVLAAKPPQTKGPKI